MNRQPLSGLSGTVNRIAEVVNPIVFVVSVSVLASPLPAVIVPGVQSRTRLYCDGNAYAVSAASVIGGASVPQSSSSFRRSSGRPIL